MKKVTGIGGVFFKSNDPQQTMDWYKKHLGFDTDQYGATFAWRDKDKPDNIGYTQWSPFKADTEYFAPSQKPFMINFTVENIEALVEQLKAEGVTVVDDIATYDYGKFVHILDNDGNKIELWEPVSGAFES